jgi:hypothetical protein
VRLLLLERSTGAGKAVLVSANQDVDLKEIKRWSKIEGKEREFEAFKKKLMI